MPRDLLEEPRDLLASPPKVGSEKAPPAPLSTLRDVLSSTKEPEKNAERSLQAITDGIAFGMKPSTAFRMNGHIETMLKLNPVANKRREGAKEFVTSLSAIGMSPEDKMPPEERAKRTELHKDVLLKTIETYDLTPEEKESARQRILSGEFPLWMTPAQGYFVKKTAKQQIKELPYSFSAGALGTIEGMVGGIQWLSGDSAMGRTAKEVADWFEELRKDTAPGRPTFLNDVAGGFGSMFTFLLPSVGASATATRLLSGAPKVAKWVGASTMATTESFTEAGAVYRESLDDGKPRTEAEGAAKFTFWANMPLLLVTNKLGLFADKASIARRFLLSAPLEGTQEMGQAAISDVALGKPVNWSQAMYEGFIGSIVGGGASFVLSALEKVENVKEMPPELRAKYDEAVERHKDKGIEQAHIEATKEIAKTPEGAAYIEHVADAMDAVLKAETAMGREIPEGKPEVEAPKTATEALQKGVAPTFEQISQEIEPKWHSFGLEKRKEFYDPEKIRQSGGYELWDFDENRWWHFKTETEEEQFRERYPLATLTDSPAGPERVWYRYGKPPESKRSVNYAENMGEYGVSVYATPEGGAGAVFFAERDVWRGRGRQVGWGSDGEPLIIPTGEWVKFTPETLTDEQIDKAFSTEDDIEGLLDTLLDEAEDIETGEEGFIDPTAEVSLEPVMEKLRELPATAEEAVQNVQRIANSVYAEGQTTLKDFTARMKEVLGELYEKFKEIIKKVYESAKAFNERLGEEGAIGKPDRRAKKRIREATGQIKDPELQDLRDAMRKAERAGRVAFRAGKKEGVAEARAEKAPTTKQIIRQQTGQIKDPELRNLRDAMRKAVQAGRVAFRAGNKEGMAKAKAQVWEIAERRAELAETRKTVKTLKKAVKRKGFKGNIAVEYQKKITEVLKGVDLKKPTAKTLKRLKSLKEFIEREGTPLEIKQKHINELDRLSKTSVRDMTKEDLKSLKETVEHLKKLGKLKQRIKMKYDQQALAERREKLIKSTRNLDPEVSDKPSKFDTYKVSGLQIYMNTLHSPRVADMIDGFKDYAGENAKMIKEQGAAETRAKHEAQVRVATAIEKIISESGITEITEDILRKVNVHLMLDQNARGQAAALMAYYEFDTIPELSEAEQKFKRALQAVIGAKTTDIAATYEEIEVEPFTPVENYWPIKYRGDFNLLPGETINQNRYRTTQVEKGFTKTRKPNVEKLPRTDLLAVLEEAINEQEWYLHLAPVLEEHRQLVLSPEYQEAAGEIVSNFWKNQIDLVARRGWSATAQASPLLRQLRLNLNVGILGYKGSSILMQPFAIFDAMAWMNAKHGTKAAVEVFEEFSKAWVIPNYAKEFIDVSPALQTRKGGEVAIEETLAKVDKTQGKWSKFVRGSMSLLQAADVKTAAGVEKGILKVLERHGSENPLQEAEFLMNLVSGSAEVAYRPHILGRGEGARMWFTFQTFFMNRWGILIHDLIRSGLFANPLWKRKFAALISIGVFMAGGLGEDEARELVYEVTTGKELPEEDIAQKLLLYIPKHVPYLGNVLEAAFQGRTAEPPAVRAISGIFEGGAAVIKGKKAETKVRGTMRMSENMLALIFGVPGTAQMFDLFEYALLGKQKKTKKSSRR